MPRLSAPTAARALTIVSAPVMQEHASLSSAAVVKGTGQYYLEVAAVAGLLPRIANLANEPVAMSSVAIATVAVVLQAQLRACSKPTKLLCVMVTRRKTACKTASAPNVQRHRVLKYL